jgi:hypothetical protein
LKATFGLNTGAAGIGKSALPSEEGTPNPTLSDMGISHNLSSLSQILAGAPEAEFESEMGELLRAKKEAG